MRKNSDPSRSGKDTAFEHRSRTFRPGNSVYAGFTHCRNWRAEWAMMVSAAER